MKIEFEKIDWTKFQDLCTDILEAEGFKIIRRAGIGSDRGMDILIQKQIEYGPGCSKSFIWLVQCKYRINNGSLKSSDVGEFISDISRHNADGYWLMTNTYLSTSLEDKITSVNNSVSNPYKVTYSDIKNIEDLLHKHRNIQVKYFPPEEGFQKGQFDWKKVNPFKELQAFTEIDKDFFYGRKDEINQLISKIYKYKIIGLFGESGSGKTSLINAGLIPLLKSENFLVISVRCLDEPIKRIREALNESLVKNNFPSKLIERLAVADSFPHLIIELNSIVENEKLNLIIVIDQLEEIFTRASEREKDQLSKGIAESLIQSSHNGRICFLLSLREDYIGSLWDWSHTYLLEDAWIHAYRISRLTENIAFECIAGPLAKIGIKVDKKFIESLVNGLKTIGDGLIYPPYLQILCSKLFDKYLYESSHTKNIVTFDKSLYREDNGVELIIADYLSESMLEGLTEDEKRHAENILDILTGPKGLRAFLSIEDIARNIGADISTTKHVIEHLTRKKIVHTVVDKDVIVGHELVHDFLSKKFFERLAPEAKLAKTTIEILRKAFKEWKDHKVLASKDRLDILISNFTHLKLNDEELFFLVKSSFSVFWFDDGGNNLLTLIDKEKIAEICKLLVNDEKVRIAQEAIRTLGATEKEKATPILIEIIKSTDKSNQIRETTVDQFWWNITDLNILDTLKYLIKNEKEFKIRKSAVYAFGKNVAGLSRLGTVKEDIEIEVLLEALNDSRALVRKQIADVFSYIIVNKKSITPLIERLKIESSISTKKSIVIALGALLRKGEGTNSILTILENIAKDQDEDYRVKEEARLALERKEGFDILTKI